jgi:hypothetical protein
MREQQTANSGTTFFYLDRASYKFYLRASPEHHVQVWTVGEGFGIGSEFRPTCCAGNNFRNHEVLFRWFKCSNRSPSGFVIHTGANARNFPQPRRQCYDIIAL